MKLSVIILNYNVRYFLELCLKSVEAAINGIDAEIIVVDNNSIDDSCTMVKQLFPTVHLIENKVNLGFSKGNNIGVAKAKGEYLCILNPDTVVAEDTFTKILNFADTKQNIGIVGCQLIDGSGEFLSESKRHIPTPKVALQKLLGYTKNYYDDTIENHSNGEAAILVGAFMVLKRAVYNAVNGFDEDYFMYGEDIDLSYKILKSGYSNYYFGEATIIHFKGESTLKDNIYAQRFYGAMEIFYSKHFKSNLIFTALIKFGIRVASKWKKTNPISHKTHKQSLVLSELLPESLKNTLPQPIVVTSNLSEISKQSLVVLEADIISYKTIIDAIKSNKKSTNNSFRILPKNSSFILGSDSSIGRGEVIQF
ncbi:MAG: glycosyltransferase family 2 protein [Winogradskyella sp.]